MTGDTGGKRLHRNVWAASVASFLTDVSSEMVTNLIPLFLYGTLGVKANIIGLIEGVAGTTASVIKVGSGVVSDRLQSRKWLAVAGYALSTLAKPFFYLASTWGAIASVRWVERVGKGIRTAPRDALVADSVQSHQRGFAFGLHRAADTAGAVLGLLIAWLVLTRVDPGVSSPDRATFQLVVLLSLIPAVLAVVVLAVGSRDIPSTREPSSRPSFRGLGRPFLGFLAIVALFDLGNSSDAFVILRASERGLDAGGVLLMLATFNVVYAVTSTPAGAVSDRLGRKNVLLIGWIVYAVIYAGLGFAETAWQVWALYAAYGLYHGLTVGTGKALVADLVPASRRASAYGAHAATLGLIDLPASLIAGVLWHGVGDWTGFGPSAPFLFGSATALLAAVALALYGRRLQPLRSNRVKETPQSPKTGVPRLANRMKTGS